MQKNSSKFSSGDAQRLASTPAGQQLLKSLQSSDTDMMKRATQHMLEGNTEAAKQLLLPLLQDPTIAELLKQLGG